MDSCGRDWPTETDVLPACYRRCFPFYRRCLLYAKSRKQRWKPLAGGVVKVDLYFLRFFCVLFIYFAQVCIIITLSEIKLLFKS